MGGKRTQQKSAAPGDAALPPSPPTIHEAELASGPDGAVEYGAEIDEATAVARRKNGDDIVVRGPDHAANRALARKIEDQVTGRPGVPHWPHTGLAGRMALPHFQQELPPPRGHSFYETNKRTARRKR